MAKKPDDVMSTRLRMPVGVHRLLMVSAKRNNRSINSEILWALAQHLGEEAQRLVERMTVEQRNAMQRVLQALVKDPERAARAIENFEREMEGDSAVPKVIRRPTR